MSGIDLMAFCAQADEARPLLERPWFEPRLDLTVATCGRVMVFVSGRHEQAVDRPPEMPADRPVAQLALYRPGGRAPLPELPALERVPCPCCMGGGQITDENAEENEGVRLVVCPWCGGDAYDERNRPIQIGRAWFGEVFLRKLATLPGLMFSADPVPCGNERHPVPASFEFDGGFGLVMPRRTPEKCEL